LIDRNRSAALALSASALLKPAGRVLNARAARCGCAFAGKTDALAMSANPRLTSAQVRSVLQETADKIGPRDSYKASGHSNEFGYGRVNAARAVAQARWLAAGKSAPRRNGGKVRRAGPRGA
jgi:hypothetical protein